MNTNSSPKTIFEWVTRDLSAEAQAKVARAIRRLKSSSSDEKQRYIAEFTPKKKRAGWNALAGLVAFVGYVVLAYRLGKTMEVAGGFDFLIVILGLSVLAFAYVLVRRPVFTWVAWSQRLSSLRLTRSVTEFLSWFTDERPPYVLFLRDFRSWSEPRLVAGGLLSKDPLVRELSWALPEDVFLVSMHNPREAATKLRNVIHVLAAGDAWEDVVQIACEFASMIVISPRECGESLERELQWIRDSETLQQKTLLLYDPVDGPTAGQLGLHVRWSAPLFRPSTVERVSGLDELPDGLQLVRYRETTGRARNTT
jgi:hypothetical protein